MQGGLPATLRLWCGSVLLQNPDAGVKVVRGTVMPALAAASGHTCYRTGLDCKKLCMVNQWTHLQQY